MQLLPVLLATAALVQLSLTASTGPTNEDVAKWRPPAKNHHRGHHHRHSISKKSSDDNREASNQPKNTVSYQTKWYTDQLVDHFTWFNQDTWKQRYLVNSDHWCGKNCPILFYAGNEGDIEMFTNNTGWMWENAAKLNAMLVFAEHRFYGKSMPYSIVDNPKSLGYLSSEQALADYAKLIHELRNNIYDAKYSPVIAVGGSYGGMLAAWLRMKYPNAVAGALAGSAPVLQFPDEYDCEQFNKIVSKDYEGYSPNCSRFIAKSWSTIREMAAPKLNESDHELGLDKLSRLFNTCKSLQAADVTNLLQLLSAIWVNLAMTDYANEATFLAPLPAYPIKHVCELLDQDPGQVEPSQLVERISLASQVYTNYTGQAPCLDIEASLNDPMDVMWDYQSCTEMVMPICSDGTNDMFDPQPFDIAEFVAGCKARWGVQTRVNNVVTLYGDKSLEGASNIIFSSCSRDPWSAGCPQQSIKEQNIYAIKIPDVCHHEDLRFSGPGDKAEVKKARQEELSIVSGWIRGHYEQVKARFSNETLVWLSRGKNDAN